MLILTILIKLPSTRFFQPGMAEKLRNRDAVSRFDDQHALDQVFSVVGDGDRVAYVPPQNKRMQVFQGARLERHCPLKHGVQ